MFRNYQRRPILLRGAVIKQDDDPMKESPITDVEVSAADGLATSTRNPISPVFSQFL